MFLIMLQKYPQTFNSLAPFICVMFLHVSMIILGSRGSGQSQHSGGGIQFSDEEENLNY